MSKKDIGPILVVLALIAVWAGVDRYYIAPRERATAEAAAALAAAAASNQTAAARTTGAVAAASGTAAPVRPEGATVSNVEADTTPAQAFELKNEHLVLTLTSRGASVEKALLTKYPRSLTNKVDCVALDFTDQTALAYGGLDGLTDQFNFLAVEQKEGAITLERQGANGLTLRRTITIGTNYVVSIRDEFSNRGSSPVTVPTHTLRTGLMSAEEGHRNMIGFAVLGVDTLTGGSDGVKYWGAELSGWFEDIQKASGLPKIPESIQTAPLDEDLKERSVDWIAAKNKYFTQIIAPKDGADACLVQARRVVPAYEKGNPAAPAPGDAEIEAVAGLLQFKTGQTIQPGQALAPREMDYFIGPKKFGDLRDLRRHQVDVMELGFWAPVGKTLLWVLSFIHDHIVQNYGIAIMLLTVIVRTVFWPLTHKSTMSMKRMAKLQPLMLQLREKYKGNPQKMQAETMALYRQHKINPVAGCLPMIIQIPVFIALFVILRSAIELRYASFLWIRDLSEPERILEFGFTIPLLGWDALNLLPLAMTATMVLQMKLTPTAGDPQQQKIMLIMMPIMMLFMLYGYASGLALYWTTTNIISIFQQLYYRKLSHDEPLPVAPAPQPAGGGRKKK